MKRSRDTFIKILLFFIFSIPFVFYNNTFEYIKFIYFVGGINVGVILYLFSIFIRGSKNIAIKDSSLFVYIGLFFIVTLLASLQGEDITSSLLGGPRYQGMLLLISLIELFFLVIYAKSKKTIFYVTVYVLIASTLLSLITIWQGTQVYILNNLTIATYNGRIGATFGNPNSLAGFLAMCFPFILYSKTNNYKQIIVRTTVIVINLLAILFTGSRGALLAVSIVLALYLVLPDSTRLKLKFKSLLLPLVLFISITILLLFIDPRLETIYSGLQRYSIWNNQFLIWNETFRLVMKQPLLGYGLETMNIIFPDNLHFSIDDPHNIFLSILVSSGIIGLVVFLLLFINAYKDKSIIIKLALLVFIIRAQFNPLSVPEIVFFWLLLAV